MTIPKLTIPELFNKTGGKKIEFNPAIRVVKTGKPTVWIDAISEQSGAIYTQISNHKDNYRIRIDMLDNEERAALLKRLTELQNLGVKK